MNLNLPRNTTNYLIGGTKFFRLASKMFFKNFPSQCGSNLQNIDKNMRAIYIPDDGYEFVQVDQSGADALIVAFLCRPGNKLRELFANKVKPHTYLGTIFKEQWEKEFPSVHELAKLPIPELKNHPDWPKLAKAIADSDNNPPATRYYYHYKQTGHSGNYDIGVGSFILNILEKSGGKVALTQEQGKRYLSGYNMMIPELREFQSDVRTQLEKTHTLYNLFGYPLYFHTVNERMYKEGYSAIPQSTVGCITHIAYTNMYNYISDSNLDWHLLANTHDSYLLQCPIGEGLDCAKKGKEFMEQELTSPRGEKFRMRSEAAVGMNWSPWSEKKNPQGLKEVKI